MNSQARSVKAGAVVLIPGLAMSAAKELHRKLRQAVRASETSTARQLPGVPGSQIHYTSHLVLPREEYTHMDTFIKLWLFVKVRGIRPHFHTLSMVQVTWNRVNISHQ